MAVEFKYGDYIKGGVDIFKANLVPSVVAGACMMFIPIVNMQVMVNYLRAVKEAKNSGKPIDIGSLFNFDNFVNNVIAIFIMALSACCCYVPMMILFMTPAILADHPGISFMDAVKTALAFGKRNPVPMIILSIIIGFFISIGFILIYIGAFATMPIGYAALWYAYDEHKATVTAAAAEDGITLA